MRENRSGLIYFFRTAITPSLKPKYDFSRTPRYGTRGRAERSGVKTAIFLTVSKPNPLKIIPKSACLSKLNSKYDTPHRLHKQSANDWR